MKRKKFLATAFSAIPMIALAKSGVNSLSSLKKPFIVRAGEARYGKPMFYKGKHPNNIVISKKDTGGAMSVFAYTGHDKIGPSTHLHLFQDEIFFVTEGTYRFLAGEETLELHAGDSIFLPRNVPHSWIQLTDKGQLIYAVHPSGTMEEFFIEMNEMKAPPTETEAKKIHLKHGMKLIGPGLSL
ncbi:MAG: cupin domain-containing protein [Chitinophagaceae bacterium]